MSAQKWSVRIDKLRRVLDIRSTNMNTTFDVSKWQHMVNIPLLWGVILIGLSVPISVAFDNILLALILLGAVCSLASISRIAVFHPVARAALLLFALLFIATLYGSTPMKAAFEQLAKYIDLAFIPIFIFLLSTDTHRRRARYAFLLAMAITLLVSYAVGLKIVPVMAWMNVWTYPENPAIFHSHITQNNMMAFAIFLALLEWRDEIHRVKKIAWALFALLGSINILFMVQGRTGYLIFFVLLGWFVWSSIARVMQKRGKAFGWKQGVLILLGLCAVTIVAYNSSVRLHDRLASVGTDFQLWVPGEGSHTSTGERLDFYSNALQIVKHNIGFGVGTGGFLAAYEQQTLGTNIVKTRNPHNEFLLISVQTGIAGLALMLYLFYTQWRFAPKLPSSLEQDAAKGLVLACVVNCSFNSALMDHADGLFFAFMTAVLFASLKVRLKGE
jgi:O-antigen ligase